MESLGRQYEVIFVDDASTDNSFEILANLVETDPGMKVVRLRRNFGQTAALAAGFDLAQGHVILSMDGDLQHDPSDIPLLIEKIDAGYDIASGWRKVRVDNLMMRRIPSRIANWLMSKVSGVDLHDFGTTFKAYRAEVLRDVGSMASCTASFPPWRASTERASPRYRSATFRARRARVTTGSGAPSGWRLTSSPSSSCSAT